MRRPPFSNLHPLLLGDASGDGWSMLYICTCLGKRQMGEIALHTWGAPKCLVWKGHGVKVALGEDDRAPGAASCTPCTPDWGVCILLGRQWEASSSHHLWADTKPRSVGIHGVGIHGTGLGWLRWFVNPQGYDFKSRSLEFVWKAKIAHSHCEKQIDSFRKKCSFQGFTSLA